MSQSPSNGLRLALFLTFVVVPLANYLPFIDGTDQFIDDPETRVDAAGYAFSIWGIIFLGMIAFSYNVWKQKDGLGSAHLAKATPALIVAGLASITFVPISIDGNQFLGWIDIMVHLAALIYANRQLRQHVAAVPSGSAWRWTYYAPTVYMGWISAASVISTALMLDHFGVRFDPQTEIYGATALVLVLIALGSFLTRRRDFFYGLTVAWALVAVGIEQGDAALIKYTAWTGAGALLFLVLATRQFYAAPDASAVE